MEDGTAAANTGPANTAAAPGYGATSYGTLIPVDELLRRASDAKIIPVVLNDAGGIMSYGAAGDSPPWHNEEHSPPETMGVPPPMGA